MFGVGGLMGLGMEENGHGSKGLAMPCEAKEQRGWKILITITEKR